MFLPRSFPPPPPLLTVGPKIVSEKILKFASLAKNIGRLKKYASVKEREKSARLFL
jgi:hypothetical protein